MAAGGSWTTQNKIRPGVYIRFRSKALTGLTVGERGTVALCAPLHWGAVDTVQEVEAGVNLIPFTGFALTDPENLLFQQLLLGTNRTPAPTKVLLYRPEGSGSAKATATVEPLTATARHPGSRGNDISLAVTALVDAEGSFTVSTIVDGDIVDTQTAQTVEELKSNDWVTFSGSGPLAATTGTALSGGLDGTVDGADYAKFLEKIEPFSFDVLLYDGSDPTVQQAMIAFIKRMADENGQHGQLVLAQAQNPDSRFVVNVSSGVQLSGDNILTPEQTAWWVAGALAGAPFNQSLTGATYPGALAVSPVRTSSQIADCLTKGLFVLSAEQGVVRVEQDINTLVTFTQEISNVYRKNRVMRLCSTMANDIYRQFAQNFLGTVHNNAQGRAQLKAVILGYLLEIQSANGIQNLVADDVEVLPGNEIDAVVVNLAIQPVDSMEKIYVTMELA